MKLGSQRVRLRTASREFRIMAAVVALSVVGTVTGAIITSARNGQAFADIQDFVRIEDVKPNVSTPANLAGASTGAFTVDCGTNGNKKFSPDNPVAQPGIKNGAQHVHDFVGNLAINADSTDDALAAAGTTCKNGDKSSYFWPVVRIDDAAAASRKSKKSTKATKPALGTPKVSCPTVKDKLPAVPDSAMAEVTRNLAQLDAQLADANRRVEITKGEGGANFIENAIVGPLRAKRAATIDRIAIAIGRSGSKPSGLVSLADCELSYDGAGHSHGATASRPGGSAAPVVNAATPTVNCPTVRDRLPGVPASAVDEVNRELAQLDRQIAEANERLVTSRGEGGANFVDNAILGPLKAKRTATIDRIAISIDRASDRPTGLDKLAGCTLANGGKNNAGNNNAGNNNAGNNAGNNNAGNNNGNDGNNNGNNGGADNAGDGAGNGGDNGAGDGADAEEELPGPSGPDFELPGNEGGIVRPAQVLIEYRGNPTGKVVAMPRFLRALTGDAKPTSRGPANARASWTCSGFADRLSTKYPICPQGSMVQRVHDFPGCWDGKNIDSDNHRAHVAFADPKSGACPANFKTIPQLRITISYNIPRNVQQQGGYALDSFPEEDHNPFSDHDDFLNVNSEQQMAQIVKCVNEGRRCT